MESLMLYLVAGVAAISDNRNQFVLNLSNPDAGVYHFSPFTPLVTCTNDSVGANI